jgi:hypothetical protein
VEGAAEMKLHLHIGAHKTATTHFQDYLKKIPVNDDFYFLETDIARKNFSMEGNSCSIQDSERFYKNLAGQKYKMLLISDENICGHSYHIFRDQRLYQTIGERLKRVTFFNEIFDEIDIWLTLRSQETFLSSLYCEAIRWGSFKSFSSVFEGNFHQSWLPVIDEVKKSFPCANLNILLYENYGENFPPLIYEITGSAPSQGASPEQAVYTSLNGFSVKASSMINKFCPVPQRPFLIRLISRLSKRFSQGKFQPFSKQQAIELKQLYASDIKALEDDPAISMFHGKRPDL